MAEPSRICTAGPAAVMTMLSLREQPPAGPVRRPSDEEAERDHRLGAEAARRQCVAQLVHERERADGRHQRDRERRILAVQAGEEQQTE